MKLHYVVTYEQTNDDKIYDKIIKTFVYKNPAIKYAKKIYDLYGHSTITTKNNNWETILIENY